MLNLSVSDLCVFSDPRTKDWLLVGSPWPIACLCILYLVMVRVGQQMMIKRPAFSLQGPMIAYNLFLVLLSAYMLYEVNIITWSFCSCMCMHTIYIFCKNSLVVGQTLLEQKKIESFVIEMALAFISFHIFLNESADA